MSGRIWDRPDLKFNLGLASAALDTTVEAVNEIDDRPLTIVVKLDWDGQGDTVEGTTNLDWRSPGKSVRRGKPFSKRVRFARAVGSITASATEYAPAQDDNASITSSVE